MNALNLTAPNGMIAHRFVKNADGVTFNHYKQDLLTDDTTLQAVCMSRQFVEHLAGCLRSNGWR